MYLGAIEAGGTKFICAVGNAQLDVVASCRIATTTPEETLRQVIDFFADYPVSAIGIGSFGPIDLNIDSLTYGYITNTPKSGWQQVDLLGVIQRHFAIPVAFTTDVNASLYGEYTRGSAKGLNSAVYFTIGTGIGAGAIQHGEFIGSLSHPEMGHMLVQPHADDQFQGSCPYHRYCLEGMASGPSIAQRVGVNGADLAKEHPVWLFISDYIAQACYNVTLILAPEKIVLGGGVMEQTQLLPLIRQRFLALMNHYRPLPAIDDYLVMPKLAGQQGIVGCFALAHRMSEGKPV